MATIRTIFSLTDDVSDKLNNIDKNLQKTSKGFGGLSSKIFNVNQAMQMFQTVSGYINRVSASLQENVTMYQIQAEAETKLETIMRRKMGASAEEIQSMKDLASEMQNVGIYGDEMILTGMQELATFADTADSVKELTPVLTNLVAQQYGYNASAEQMRSAATMMGKVLAGESGGLTRFGYTLTETEKSIIENGNEMQRSAVIAKVVTSSVGEMNKALAGNPLGNIKQMSNVLGDLKEDMGKLLQPIMQVGTQIKLAFQIQKVSRFNLFITKITPAVKGIGNVILALIPKFFAMVDSFTSKAEAFVNFIINHVNVIKNTLLAISPVLAFVGTIWLAYQAKILAMFVFMQVKHAIAMAKMAGQWIIGFGPVGVIIGLIVALIAGLIAMSLKFGDTFEKIGGVIGGVLSVIWETITSMFKGLYNDWATINNFVADSFIGKKLGVQRMEIKKVFDYKNAWENGKATGSRVGMGVDYGLQELKGKLDKQVTALNALMKPQEETEIAQNLDNLKFDSSGALETAVQNKLTINDDFKKLLSEQALRDYQLNYNQNTPSVTIETMEVRSESDADNVIDRIANAIQSMSQSHLSRAS